MIDLTPLEQALRVFCAPGQVVELRALNVLGKRAVCEVFGDLAALARQAAELDAAGAAGVYFTPNPLRPDLAGSKTSCRAADVVERHWLLIDVDPRRPAGMSATDEEIAAAWRVLDRCRGVLDSAGLEAPAVGLSGNGWQLCYPVLLPNDHAAHDLLKTVLKGLDERCSDPKGTAEAEGVAATLGMPGAAVDRTPHDAPRIWKLYGTTARKGTPTGSRPHRRSYLVEGVPWSRPTAEANVPALQRLVESWQYADNARRGRPQTDAGSYAAAALRQELAAVSTSQVGDRNNQLNRSAFALGQLVAGGALSRPEVEAALQAAGAAAGLDAGEARSTVRSGLDSGMKEPRNLSGLNGHTKNGKHAAGTRTLRVPAEASEPLPPMPTARVELFPVDVLPPQLQQFVGEGAASLCCPPDYLAVPLLCGAAAAVGASRALRLTPDWWVFPALYAAVVAPPSSTKSPAAGRSLAAVKFQQLANRAKYKADRKRWAEADDPDPDDKPKFVRTFTTDTTTEKLASLLADCPRGLLYHRDELVSWIASFNQYRDGGKGADQQTFMSIWDHQSISIERKGHDEGMPTTVQRPCLTVFGTVQPDVLNQLRSDDNGFLERILFSFAEPAGERVWHWEGIGEATKRAWREIIARLYSLQMTDPLEEGDDPWPRFVTFTDAARPAWETWYAEHQRTRQGLPEAMHPCHAKLESYCARLSLLIETLWYAASPQHFDPAQSPDVGPGAVNCAGRLVSYFLSHARRAYGCLEQTPADRRALQVVTWARRQGGVFSPRDLQRQRIAGVRKASEALHLIEDLADRGLGIVATEKADNGREVITFRLHSVDSVGAVSAPRADAISEGAQGLARSVDSVGAPGRDPNG